MGKKIKSGFAVLVLIYDNILQKYISGLFCIYYKGKAYDGSTATIDSTLGCGTVGCFIRYTAMIWLKRHGVNEYEIGPNYYRSTFDQGICNEKLINISKFKIGFGGKEKLRIEYTMLHSFDDKG